MIQIGGTGGGAAAVSQLSVAVAVPLAASLVSAGHSKVTSAGTTRTGAVVSWTVKTWVAEAVLPQGSTAVQVRVMVLAWVQTPAASVSLKVTGTGPAQLSVAVTVAAAGSASHSTLTSAGTPARTGAVVSLTVTICWQLALLPLPSAAVQVRVMTLLQLEPGLDAVSVKSTATTPSQSSRAVTVAAAGTSARHWTLTAGAGHPLKTGAVASTMEMVCTQLALLPQASVAVHVRMMSPPPPARSCEPRPETSLRG